MLLTCSIEFDPVADVPLTVTTLWNGPSGSRLTSASLPMPRSVTYYTSSVQFSSAVSADSGEYTCEATVENRLRMSVKKFVSIGKL